MMVSKLIFGNYKPSNWEIARLAACVISLMACAAGSTALNLTILSFCVLVFQLAVNIAIVFGTLIWRPSLVHDWGKINFGDGQSESKREAAEKVPHLVNFLIQFGGVLIFVHTSFFLLNSLSSWRPDAYSEILMNMHPSDASTYVAITITTILSFYNWARIWKLIRVSLDPQ